MYTIALYQHFIKSLDRHELIVTIEYRSNNTNVPKNPLFCDRGVLVPMHSDWWVQSLIFTIHGKCCNWPILQVNKTEALAQRVWAFTPQAKRLGVRIPAATDLSRKNR